MIRAVKLAPFAIALALGGAAATALPAMAQAPQETATQAQERPSRIEGRIAFLRTELGITDAQAKLWEDVAAALRENDRARRDAFSAIRKARNSPTTALDRLEQRQKMAELQAASAARLHKALAPLYAAMSDAQKKDADQLLGGHNHHRRMGHRRI